MQQVKKNKFIYWIAGLVSIGGILYGYDMGGYIWRIIIYS